MKSLTTVMFGLIMVGVVHADEKPIRVADIPREFKGTFEWRDADLISPLKLTINKIEEKDGVIIFTGSHHYLDTDSRMKVEGTIIVRNRRITLRESEPTSANAVTDGSFEGVISADLESIEAVWTTESTGKKGDLRHKGKKSSALGGGVPMRK